MASGPGTWTDHVMSNTLVVLGTRYSKTAFMHRDLDALCQLPGPGAARSESFVAGETLVRSRTMMVR